MNRLLHALDIHPAQFRALFRLALRHDMRRSRLAFGWQRQGRNPKLLFLTTLIYYLILGIFLALFNASTSSVFLGVSVTVSGLIFLLGGVILIEYNHILISPDDYPILGYMPVGSRTYFLAKLANMLLYVLSFAILLGGPTVLVHTLKEGFQPLRGVLTFLAVLSAGIFISLAVVGLYGQLMRVISPRRLHSVLSYLQFTISFVIYGGYIFLPDLLKNFAAEVQITKTFWLLLLPSTWFAAIAEFGYYPPTTDVWLGLACAVLSISLLTRTIFSHLSLEYAQRIAILLDRGNGLKTAKSPANRRLRLPLQLFRSPANRIVSKLIVAQFRYDNKFKLSIMGILPLLFFYFYVGLREGALPDPFIEGAAGIENFLVFFFAILMLPLIFKQNLDSSDAYQASWLFFAAPISLSRLVLAARNLLFMLASIPAIIVVLGIFLYYFENPVHAVLHAMTIAFLSFNFLQLVYLLNPRLPFSEPKVRGGQSRLFTALFVLLPVSGILLLIGITEYFYARPGRVVGLYCFFLGSSFFLEWMIHRRIRTAVRRLQFSG